MPRRLPALALLATLALAGCGQDAELPGEPVDDSPAGRFFAALTEDLGGASGWVVPGSPAAQYVRFQQQLGSARADAGIEPVPAVVRRSADGYLLCEEGEPPRCAEVTRVVLEGDRVRGFRVDGTAIRDRLGGPGEPRQVPGAGRVRVVAAYEQPTTGGLWVLLGVQTGPAAVAIVQDGSSYARTDAAEALQVLVPREAGQVAPRADATVALVVAGGRLGGTLHLRLDVAGAPVDVEIPIRR